MTKHDSVSVATELRRRIDEGRLPEGERPAGALPPLSQSPSKREVAERYGVAITTAEKAIASLIQAKLILNAPRRRSMIAPPIPTRTVHHDRVERRNVDDLATLFVRDMAAAGWHSQTIYTYVGEVPAPEWAARVIGVEVGSPLWGRVRKLVAAPVIDGEPLKPFERTVAIYESLYVMRLVGIVPEMTQIGNTGTGGIISRIVDAGIDLDDFDEAVLTRAPRSEDSELADGRDLIPEMIRTVSIRGTGEVIAAERERSLPEWLVRTYRVKV